MESVTYQFHARMLSLEVAQSLKSYGHFSSLGVVIALSHRNAGKFRAQNYADPKLPWNIDDVLHTQTSVI